MKKNYVSPKGVYVRFDVEDVLTKRLPLKNYSDTDAPDTETGFGSMPEEDGL